MHDSHYFASVSGDPEDMDWRCMDCDCRPSGIYGGLPCRAEDPLAFEYVLQYFGGDQAMREARYNGTQGEILKRALSSLEDHLTSSN